MARVFMPGNKPLRWLARPLLPTAVFAALLAMPATAHSGPAAHASANAPAGCTGPAGALWLRVVVDGMRSSNGVVAITLYPDDSSRFLVHHGSLYVGRVRAVAGTTDGCIYVPKAGVYVVAIYHDENNNGKFDRTSLGMPAEGYGFSNNPSTLLGLPSFDAVRLNIPRAGLISHIHIKYP